jgi:hypothetical protein
VPAPQDGSPSLRLSAYVSALMSQRFFRLSGQAGGLLSQRSLNVPEAEVKTKNPGRCQPDSVVEKFSYFPFKPMSLPTPVTKSQPGAALKLPALPEVISRKSLVLVRLV